MLIKFSLRNYKVFREKAELSLIASNYDKDTNEANVTDVPKFGLRLLKSAVIYGANASGKTKLIEALNFMGWFVENSSKESQAGDPIPVHPFLLSTETEHQPTEVEVVFIHDDVIYRYGFEVTQQRVVAEWLFHRPHTKEVELFYRDADETVTHPKQFGGIVNQLIKANGVRDNALLLSVAAQFNHKLAQQVLNWFRREVRILSGIQEDGFQDFTMSQSVDKSQKQKILKLLQEADLSIDDFSLSRVDIDQLPTDMPDQLKELLRNQAHEKKTEFVEDVMTKHRKYDANHMPVELETFSLEHDESSGTKKFFALTGPILDVLANGYTLVVDELDAKLHPNLICKLVDIFNATATNPKNAQLIFNTQDTNLLSSGQFRRDQIWFTEKDRYGAVTLYSLGEFKIRNNKNFETDYIQGRYGAIPFLGDFTRLFNQSTELIHAGSEE